MCATLFSILRQRCRATLGLFDQLLIRQRRGRRHVYSRRLLRNWLLKLVDELLGVTHVDLWVVRHLQIARIRGVGRGVHRRGMSALVACLMVIVLVLFLQHLIVVELQVAELDLIYITHILIHSSLIDYNNLEQETTDYGDKLNI